MTTTTATAVSRYTTGFCGTRRHHACPQQIRCTDTLTIVCACTCHTPSSPAAGGGEALAAGDHIPAGPTRETAYRGAVASALGRWA